jgi:hypothetical protein
MKKWIVMAAIAALLGLASCGGGGGGGDAAVASGAGAGASTSTSDTSGSVASGGSTASTSDTAVASTSGSVGSGGTGAVASNGGGVGSGGTGITGGGVGYVSGFGSIYVNGTRFGIDTASLSLADEPALKLGMSVKVTGSLEPDFLTGTATSVESGIDARGPISNLDTAAGTFKIQGLVVSTDAETIYEGVTSLAGLNNTDWVKVYGHAWGAGFIRASRIEKLSAASTLILSGGVSSLDKTSQTFSLGNLTIQYGAAKFLGGVDASSLANGVLVRIRATAAAAGGVLVASSLQAWYPLPLSDSNALSVSGVITNYSSRSTFQVLGYLVDASTALVTGGLPTAIGDGVKVEVAGIVQGGVLKASKIKIRQIPGTGGPANFTATGPIGQFVSASSFLVQGQPVDASGSGVTFIGGTSSGLKNAVKVTVVGESVVSGVLIAKTVTFTP